MVYPIEESFRRPVNHAKIDGSRNDQRIAGIDSGEQISHIILLNTEYGVFRFTCITGNARVDGFFSEIKNFTSASEIFFRIISIAIEQFPFWRGLALTKMIFFIMGTSLVLYTERCLYYIIQAQYRKTSTNIFRSILLV